MLEHRKQPLLSRRAFAWRVGRSALVSALLISASLAVGILGYRYTAGLPWIDALLNASMILTGMGPVSPLLGDAAKLFASAYALFAGVVFIASMGFVIAPIAHRLLHRFHLGTALKSLAARSAGRAPVRVGFPPGKTDVTTWLQRNAVVLLLTVASACAGNKPTEAAPSAEARGAVHYARLCATCHGPAGNGYVADNAPSLRSPTFLSTATDEFLEAAILRGRPGTAMGGYARATGGPLGPAEAKDVVSFLRAGGPPRVPLPPPRAPGDAGPGKVVYDAFCLRCHGSKVQRSSAVHLANAVLLETASDAFLRHAIEVGRPPTSMVPWKGALTDKQIDDVLAYIRSLRSPAPAAPPPAGMPPAAPRTGPIVLNPKGRAPDFVLKDERFVSIDQVKAAMDGKRRMIIADARGPAEWATLHIAGAISTPYYDAKSLDDIPNDGTWVLAYCACPHHVSGEVVDALRKRGYKHTAVIDEGVFAWQQKGYPIVTAPGTPPPPAPPAPHPH